jgi:lambda family phage portal protein
MKKRSNFHKIRSNITKMDGDPMSLAFDSGGMGKRSQNWGYSAYSPNSAISESGNLIVERSRESKRKNGFAHRALITATSDEVGSQITPYPTTPYPDFNEQILELWRDHEPDLVAGGIIGGYGAFFLAVMARQTSGEVFIRRRPRFKNDGFAVPLQIQLLESDFVPFWYNSIAANGNQIINGLEFDKIGNRAAYWMHQSHPQELNFNNDMTLVRVPASEIIHHFIPDLGRIGQQRGVPTGVQSLVPLRVWATFDDNESEKAASQAGYLMIVRRAIPSAEQLEQKANLLREENRNKNSVTSPDVNVNQYNVGELTLEPNTVQILGDDEDVTFAPSYDSRGGDSFRYNAGLRASSGLGVSYAQMTGDWSKTNDRVLRFAANNDRRIIKQRLALFTIPQVCQGIWKWLVDAAVLDGSVDVKNYRQNRRKYLRCEWIPHAFDYIHPVQDVQSKVILKDNGYIDKDTQVREMNGNPIQIDNQRAEIMKREKLLGIDAISLMNEVNAAKAVKP